MYRAASPIFDVHEFPSLRHVKPLPKRRRTSSGSQSDTDVGLGPTSTTPGVNGHPFNLTHLTNYPQSHSPTNPSSSSLSSTTPNSNSNLNHSIPLSSYPLPMSASDAAATAAIAEELLAQAAGSIMSRSALQHLQNFMPDLWNAALAAATAGIGATSTSGLNGSDFVGQSAGSRMQGDLDFDAYAAAAAGVASDNSVLVDHLEEALDAVNHAHHEDEDEDEENDDEGGYNTDHLHQHYGHGNTKKRKVPANSSGSSMMRHHRGDEDEDEDDDGDDGSRLDGTLSNGGRLGDNHHGYSSSAIATSGPSSGVGSGGGPGTLSSPTSTSMSPQTLVGHPHHHRQPYTPLSRRAKITAATLAGLQHKEMLKSRKRQLAAVLGALSLGDTLALDQALSASYPFLMGGSSGATSGRRHTSSSAGGGGLEEYAQAMGLLTTGSGSGGTTTTSMGTKNMDASLPRVRLSKRQNVRLMRKTKVLIIARRKELELVERQRREGGGEEEGVVVAQRKVRDQQQQQQRKEQERKGAQTSTPTTKSGKKDKSKKAGAGKGSVPLALPAPPPPPPSSSLEETMGKALQRYEPQLQITQLASFPESGFSFVCPSSTAERLVATKEEVAMLRHRFEAELARQAAKAAKLAATNKVIAAAAAAAASSSTTSTPTSSAKKAGGKGAMTHVDGNERSAKRTNANVTPQKMKKNSNTNAPQQHRQGGGGDTSPTRSMGASQHNLTPAMSSSTDLASVLQQPTTNKSRNKKKKRSALANASNPHHLRNYVPSRLPSSGVGGSGGFGFGGGGGGSVPWGSGGGFGFGGGGGHGGGGGGYLGGMSYEKQQKWLEQQQRDWVSPLPLRFLLAEIPSSTVSPGVGDEQGQGRGKGQRKKGGKKGGNAGNGNGAGGNNNSTHIPQLMTNPMDEWICAFCEYDLFYGGEQGYRKAVRSRKKILRRRRRARERAAAAASGHFGTTASGGGMKGTEGMGTGIPDEEEEEDDEFDRTGPDKMGDGDEYDVGYDEDEGDAYG